MFSKFFKLQSGGLFPLKSSLHFERTFNAKQQVLAIRRFASSTNQGGEKNGNEQSKQSGWRSYTRYFFGLFRSNSNPDLVDRKGMRRAAIVLGIFMTFGGLYLYNNADRQQLEGAIYQFSANDIDGNPVDLNKYKGKNLVIIAPCSS